MPCVVCGFDMISNVLVYDKDKTELSLEVKLFGCKNEVSGVGLSSHPLSLIGTRS